MPCNEVEQDENTGNSSLQKNPKPNPGIRVEAERESDEQLTGKSKIVQKLGQSTETKISRENKGLATNILK